MKTRIPPLLVTVSFGLCIYFSRGLLPNPGLNWLIYLGWLLELLGLFSIVAAVVAFRKEQTTANPLQPGSASSLVTEGVFSISRNPMYLGMLLILCGVASQLNPAGGVIAIPLFVLYMTIFQIIPEERAMLELFGDDFRAYQERVRRWV